MLVLAPSWFPLPIAVAAALVVVVAFALLGFSYLDALPALHDRYQNGVGGRRPANYWTWGGLAALAFSAGPLAGAGLAHLLGHARAQLRNGSTRAIAALAAASVLVADASQLSNAEVERIWLPFVPWLLLSCALLPERWRRRGLVLQLAVALAVLAAFLGALELGSAHVLGLSWGGSLALALYGRHPEGATSLILADTYAGWKGSLSAEGCAARLEMALNTSTARRTSWFHAGYQNCSQTQHRPRWRTSSLPSCATSTRWACG